MNMQSTSNDKAKSEPSYIVYDGECPFCSNYVSLIRIRDVAGPVELINARSHHPIVDKLLNDGYDLDEGMAFVSGDTVYYGEECINKLALMSTPSTFFNRLNGLVFRHRTLSKMLYPIMRFGRNTTLKILGRRSIKSHR